jgi:hypothetical protein
MTGTGTRICVLIRQLGVCVALAAALGTSVRSAYAVVVYTDGFGDADRNNDGAITSYDTDWNDSGTFNDATADAALITRGITEVTAATDPTDVGIIWSGIRSFDTTANIAKGKLRIINDNVAIGSETSTQIHNDGLALGVEARGGGSSIMGRFPQSVDLGTSAGDKVVVSVDFRAWAESNNPTAVVSINELRWGVFEDTDNELGMTAPYGNGWFTGGGTGATVMWGRDDGKWFDAQPGAEGDKGIHVQYEFGDTLLTSTANSRIRWEYNLAGINGTTNNARILEGTGVSDTPSTGGDVGTIATPPTDGTGGEFDTLTPHTLKIEIVRLADGLAEIASFIDGVEVLRDEIKTTDTGYNLLQPPAFSYDYVAFRNTADYDYAIDNFKIETFGGVPGDYNSDGTVNAADYVLWRKGGTLANEVADPGTISAADYTEWRARFGNPAGSGASLEGAAVPEPATISSLIFGAIAVLGLGRRRFAQA